MEAYAGRGRARFEPADDQKEREAQKIALYLTLRKHREIAASDARETLVGDYTNWIVRTLRDHYLKGSEISLVPTINSHIMELP